MKIRKVDEERTVKEMKRKWHRIAKVSSSNSFEAFAVLFSPTRLNLTAYPHFLAHPFALHHSTSHRTV
jgi:hypothetical protein